MDNLARNALLGLVAAVVTMPAASLADDIQPLKPCEAVLDTAPTTSPQKPAAGVNSPQAPGGAAPASSGTSDPAAAATAPDSTGAPLMPADMPPPTRLNGSVSRMDTVPGAAPVTGAYMGGGAAGVPAIDPRAFSGGRMGGGTSMTMDMSQLGKLMQALQEAKKSGDYSVFLNGNAGQIGPYSFVKRTPTMSSDEFRRLEHGIIGLDSTITFDSDYPRVTYCYPTCPAAQVGIKPGDYLVKAGDHVFRRGDGQAVTWRYIGGKAGTPVDITVDRDGQEIVFHLTRMNIEDIKDDNIRRTYESILSAYGPPGQ